MSLQLAAQHLASRGRGPDTMLVHMAPSEVRSLQAVAMAHGGSLTLNPDTGLPEAGFLSSILPMIAGVGLTAMSGGALSPMMAGLLTGGVTGAATGNLRKGIMAGLGAYGGAGLGSSLAGAGAQEAILQANPGLTAGEVAREMGTPGFVQPSMTDKLTAGFKGLGSEAGRDAMMTQLGGAKGLMKYGAAALSPVLMAESGETAQRPGFDAPHRFEFDAGYTGPVSSPRGGTRFFNPRLRQMAEGGSTGMTGQSDDYYRYLMGLAPMPSPSPYAAPAATQVDLSSLYPATPQATRRELGLGIGEDGGEQPLPPNMQHAFNEQGLPNALTTALISLANTLNITSPQQGALSGLPGLITGNPLPVIGGAILGNAAQIGQMTGFSNIAESSMNQVGPELGGMSVQEGMLAGLDTVPSDPGVTTSPVDPGSAEPGALATPVDPGSATGTDIGPAATSVGPDSTAGTPGDDGVGWARGGLSSLAAFARGGYNLGDYSDGGRLLRGPGDGVSDSIPASIGNKRPARLADGEFVVPARIVSELGNGSTEAGARKLYAMMDRVQRNRGKSIGRNKVAVNSRSDKYLPA